MVLVNDQAGPPVPVFGQNEQRVKICTGGDGGGGADGEGGGHVEGQEDMEDVTTYSASEVTIPVVMVTRNVGALLSYGARQPAPDMEDSTNVGNDDGGSSGGGGGSGEEGAGNATTRSGGVGSGDGGGGGGRWEPIQMMIRSISTAQRARARIKVCPGVQKRKSGRRRRRRRRRKEGSSRIRTRVRIRAVYKGEPIVGRHGRHAMYRCDHCGGAVNPARTLHCPS